MLFFYHDLFSFCLCSVFFQISIANFQHKIDGIVRSKDWRSDTKEDSSTETDVTHPIRLGNNLDLVSRSNHFRKRRSIIFNKSSVMNDNFSSPVYKIPAFEKELIVHLHPDTAFIAPSFTTVFSWKDGTFNNTSASIPRSGSVEHCFFKGEVAGEKNSEVALSICDALTGSIRTSDYLYFISPLQNFNGTESSANDQLKPHSIQRRSLKRKNNNVNHRSSCGVNESRNRRRYKRPFGDQFSYREKRVSSLDLF